MENQLKTCSLCNEQQHISEFYCDKSKKDGLYVRCKSCAKKVSKAFDWKKYNRTVEQSIDSEKNSDNSEKHSNKRKKVIYSIIDFNFKDKVERQSVTRLYESQVKRILNKSPLDYVCDFFMIKQNVSFKKFLADRTSIYITKIGFGVIADEHEQKNITELTKMRSKSMNLYNSMKACQDSITKKDKIALRKKWMNHALDCISN